MKTQPLVPLVTLILLTILISCTKKELDGGGNVTTIIEHSCDSNSVPICEITYPNNGDLFYINNPVNIAVNAHDSDGTITEVRYYIDGIGVGSISQPPYIYEWSTENLDFGEYTLQAIAQDDDGNSVSDEITIEVIDYPIVSGSSIIIIDNDTSILLTGDINYDVQVYNDSVHLSNFDLYGDNEIGSYHFWVGILFHDEFGFTGDYIIDVTLDEAENTEYGIAFEAGYERITAPTDPEEYYEMAQGDLQISQIGDVYTIVFEGIDSEGSSISVYYNGPLEFN